MSRVQDATNELQLIGASLSVREINRPLARSTCRDTQTTHIVIYIYACIHIIPNNITFPPLVPTDEDKDEDFEGNPDVDEVHYDDRDDDPALHKRDHASFDENRDDDRDTRDRDRDRNSDEGGDDDGGGGRRRGRRRRRRGRDDNDDDVE